MAKVTSLFGNSKQERPSVEADWDDVLTAALDPKSPVHKSANKLLDEAHANSDQ